MGDTSTAVHILDIRNRQNGTDKPGHDIPDMIVRGLKAPFNAKTLPTILLWDERGLRLFDKATTDAPEYYLFGAENEILRRHASEIARIMQSRLLENSEGIPSQVLLDLGAGSLRKTAHILRALADLVPGTPSIPSVTYFALDVEEQEIQRALTRLLDSDVGSAIRRKIDAKGLHGTYEDGISFIHQGGLRETIDNESARQDGSPGSSAFTREVMRDIDITNPFIAGPQLHLLFLGASLGNFMRGVDAKFLRSLPLRAGYGDTLLLGLDHDNGREEVESAYNDRKGLARAFAMNGLKAAGTALGNSELFDLSNWEYTNFYDEIRRKRIRGTAGHGFLVYDDLGTHSSFYKCLRPHRITIPSTNEEVFFSKDELVKFATSFKYSEGDAYSLFVDANLRPIQRWMDSTSRYSLWLLERPQFALPLLSSPTPPTEEKVGVPSMRD